MQNLFFEYCFCNICLHLIKITINSTDSFLILVKNDKIEINDQYMVIILEKSKIFKKL